MSDNMKVWNALKCPPQGALKAIQGGRLKGKSDINPQWRMQAITEQFGPVGFGWTYTIDKLWTEPGTSGEVCAFALVSVKVKAGGEWSEPVPGIGGNLLVEMEKAGLHTSDEAYKMAVTDGLSVAFKAFGVAAEVYLGNFDGSKYTGKTEKTGNTGVPAPVSTDREAINARIVSALRAYGCKTVREAELTVKQFSAMPASGNYPAREGVTDYHKLTDGQAKVLVEKLERAAKDKASETPTVCADCGAPITGDKCEQCGPR